MQIFLVRHGATDWNLQGRCQGSTDLDLSDVGIRQTERMAASLSNHTIHGIYSSHLKRAQQTADIFSRHHRIPVLLETEVRELDHGELEGLTFAEINKTYAQFIQKWRSEPAEIQVPGGERLVDVAHRAWNGLNRVVQRHSAEESVIVVSHNFPILSIICRITATHLNSYRTFHLDPCGVTSLTHDRNDHWEVTSINNQTYGVETPLAR